jgi:histidine triad (HIT) family protein
MPLVKDILWCSKKEVDLIFDLESEDLKIFGVCTASCKKVGTAIPCIRVGIAVLV